MNSWQASKAVALRNVDSLSLLSLQERWLEADADWARAVPGTFSSEQNADPKVLNPNKMQMLCSFITVRMG